MKESSPFTLKSTSQSFQERQKSIFAQLGDIQTTLPTAEEAEMETDEAPPPNSKPARSVTKHYRKKESIFKSPKDVLTRNFIRRMPDFKKNPHKWTKYSLSDVQDEDMSDKTNTKAALSFLNDLKKRKDTESKEDNEGEEKKIIFRKITKSVDVSEDDKPSFRSSKVVMPEYVVGQKAKKDKKNKGSKNQSTSSELKLQHLLEDNE